MTPRRRPCILVVNDEPLIRHLVARVLDNAGYTVVIAEHGEADFQALRDAHPRIALALVNTYLPHLSGTEAVTRASEFFPGVPVLHLDTASDGPFDIEQVLQSVRDLTGSERRRIARPGGVP